MLIKCIILVVSVVCFIAYGLSFVVIGRARSILPMANSVMDWCLVVSVPAFGWINATTLFQINDHRLRIVSVGVVIIGLLMSYTIMDFVLTGLAAIKDFRAGKDNDPWHQKYFVTQDDGILVGEKKSYYSQKELLTYLNCFSLMYAMSLGLGTHYIDLFISQELMTYAH